GPYSQPCDTDWFTLSLESWVTVPPDPFFGFVFFDCAGPRRDRHSFPTRRSSDLHGAACGAAAAAVFPTLHVSYGLEFLRGVWDRSEEHTSELQSRGHLVCRLLLDKKKQTDEPVDKRVRA